MPSSFEGELALEPFSRSKLGAEASDFRSATSERWQTVARNKGGEMVPCPPHPHFDGHFASLMLPDPFATEDGDVILRVGPDETFRVHKLVYNYKRWSLPMISPRPPLIISTTSTAPLAGTSRGEPQVGNRP